MSQGEESESEGDESEDTAKNSGNADDPDLVDNIIEKGESAASAASVLANCSVFDAFPTASPDVFFLSPRVGSGDYIVPRLFNKNLSPS